MDGEMKISTLSDDRRKCYREGYLANNTLTVGENPYPESSTEHWDWIAGWAQAAQDRKTNP